MVIGIKALLDTPLVDEATEEVIDSRRKLHEIICNDSRLIKKFQVINFKVDDLLSDMEDNVLMKWNFRLNYRYRKQLKIVLLGCRMEVRTTLKKASPSSIKSILQPRLNRICNDNHFMSINMFLCNITELLYTCKWITHIVDVHPICTLYDV
ncbi:U1 protein [Pea yellow stunt virus]|uniref:U1 protein n=1 Tax=Pea yellow stunt virus TaxID=1436892 RepID=V9TPE2_9VIRU|nr:U1 protein [Pea yellow stunt virus]AHC72289.1 U1 protein [Pea yellow stunt virus]